MRKISRAIVAAALLAVAVLPVGIARGDQALSPPPGGQKYAILVGVEEYEHASLREPPLKYACDDANAMAEVLQAGGYQVSLLTDDTGKKSPALSPTKANIEAKVKEVLRQCKSQDTVIVGLAGHGLQFAGEKDAFFCPRDARPYADETKTLVSLSNIYGELEKSFAGVKIILVDACRNDPSPSRGRGLDADTAPPPPRGVATLFSCSAGQRAFEHDDLKHGVFFHHVLEGLKGEAADKDGEVTFDALSSYVRRNVPRDVARLLENQRQFPNLKADLVGVPPVLVKVDVRSTPRVDAVDVAPPKNVAPNVSPPAPPVAIISPVPGNVMPNPPGVSTNDLLRQFQEDRFDPDGVARTAEEFYRRALARERAERADEALEDYAQALRLNPRFVQVLESRAQYWLTQGDFEKAIADFTQWMRLEPANSVPLFKRAKARRDNGEIEAAKEDYTVFIRKHPDDKDAYFERAGCWVDLSRPKEAIGDYTEILKRDPEYYRALEERGRIYLDEGNFELAIADYSAFIKLVTDSDAAAFAYFNRGLAWNSLSEANKALEDFNQAIRLKPHDPEPYIQRATIWEGKEDYVRAIADYDSALKHRPQDSVVMSFRGVCWRNKGELRQAMLDFNQAIEWDATNGYALTNRADMHLAEKQFARALADYEAALKANPDAMANLNSAAKIMAFGPDPKLRNGPKAVQYATKACELSHFEDDGYLDTLAAAYAEAGDFAKAVEWEQKAIEKASEDPIGYKERLQLYRARRPYRQSL